MKGFVKACLVVLIIKILAGCSNKVYPAGNFQEKPVTVDGDLDEWDRPIRFVSSGGLMLYNVTNDNDNIYIAIETHDEATALKILRAGISIYLDPAAGKSKAISLAFPLADASSAAGSPNTANTNTSKNDLRELLLIQAISYGTTGFRNMENRLYDVSDKSRIKIALKPAVNNGLGYEVAIPVRYIFGDEPVSKKSIRNLSVGIVINAVKGAENYNRNITSGGSAGRHSGHGGGRGGNYRQNNPQNADSQSPDHVSLNKPDANWYTFRLAVKN